MLFLCFLNPKLHWSHKNLLNVNPFFLHGSLKNCCKTSITKYIFSFFKLLGYYFFAPYCAPDLTVLLTSIFILSINRSNSSHVLQLGEIVRSRSLWLRTSPNLQMKLCRIVLWSLFFIISHAVQNESDDSIPVCYNVILVRRSTQVWQSGNPQIIPTIDLTEFALVPSLPAWARLPAPSFATLNEGNFVGFFDRSILLCTRKPFFHHSFHRIFFMRFWYCFS